MTKKDGNLSLGERTAGPPKAREQQNWLDAIGWWSDGQTLGFVIPKIASGTQAAVVSPDLAPNRSWFAIYERSRTK